LSNMHSVSLLRANVWPFVPMSGRATIDDPLVRVTVIRNKFLGPRFYAISSCLQGKGVRNRQALATRRPMFYEETT